MLLATVGMDESLYFLFRWGVILQLIAIIHFVRRRPDTFWLWIIIIGGGIGALAYLFMEMLPDLSLLQGSGNIFARRNKISRLESIVKDNPSPGNLEELADAYLDDKKYARAKELYDRSISTRTDSPDPFYRRAICEIELGDYEAAVKDLQPVIARDPKYDFLRAQGLLAHAYARNGNPAEAERLFANATKTSTSSETMFNYADFLARQGRPAEARQWAQRVIDKKATLPGYLKRRERPWFRRAAALLKQLPA
jgi:hypothetical protein